MKKLFSLLFLSVCLLCASTASAQLWRIGQGACVTPGLSLTETWNGRQPCTAGASHACDNTWQVGSGAGAVIAAAPVSGSGWCHNSAEMVQTTTAINWQYTQFGETIPAGAPGDIWVTFDATSNGIAAYDMSQFLAASAQADGTAAYAWQLIWDDNASLCLEAQGSTASSCIAVTTGATHTLHLHVASGTNASSLSIDGGTPATFTENAQAAQYLTLGNASGNQDALTYYVGSITMSFPNVASCGGTYPGAFATFGSLPGGVSVANLAASTIGGNGTWTTTASITQLSASTTSLANLKSPIDVCGNWLSGPYASLEYTSGTPGQYVSYQFSNFTGTATATFLFKTDLPATDTNTYDIAAIEDSGAKNLDDVQMISNGNTLQLWLENYTGTNQGPPIPFTTGHVLCIAVTYNATGNHAVSVWDVTDNWAFLGTISAASASGNYMPSVIDIGNTGSEAQTSGYHWWYGNVQMDYRGNGWNASKTFAPPAPLPAIPSTASVYADLEQVTGWTNCVTAACSGSQPPSGVTCSGSVAQKSSPADSPRGADSVSVTGAWCNILEYLHQACPGNNCHATTNFLYHVSFYIPAADTTIQALEFDPDNFDASWEYFLSMQCDSATGDWRFWQMGQNAAKTTSAGWTQNDENGNPLPTKYPCGILSQKGTWHEMWLYGTMQYGGTLPTYTYQTFIVDGQVIFQDLNNPYPAAPYTISGGVGNFNFEHQIDNNGSAGTNSVQYDNEFMWTW